jgi:hypothetical protein
MMHTDASSEFLRSAQTYEVPPPRDRLPTLPEDLSEYAWIHTGPPSWTGEAAPELLSDEDIISDDEPSPLDAMTSELLLDLWHSDVPTVIASTESIVDEREAWIVALIDGRATIGALLETSGLPLPDVLGSICELSARGIIDLDRSQRIAR